MNDNFRFYGGASSSAVLGYIHGGAKGAIQAAKIFTKYNKMAPTHRTPRTPSRRRHSDIGLYTPRSNRRRQSLNPLVATPTPARRGSLAMSQASSHRSHAGSGRSAVHADMHHNRTMEGGAIRTAKVRHVGKPVKPAHVKKVVHVPKKLREQIKVVNEPGSVYGSYKEIKNGVLNQTGTGVQNADYALQYNQQNNTLFSAHRVLHVASRLFNNKAATVNPQISDVGFLDIFTSTIHVVKQGWIYRLKNNYLRTIYLNVMQVVSKRNASTPNDPLDQWSQELIHAQAEGYIKGTPTILPSTLYSGPKMLQQWNKAFKYDELQITLEPGQTYEFTITGPSMTYRMADFYDGLASNAYIASQKQDVVLMTTYWPDLIVDGNGNTAGRNAEPRLKTDTQQGGNVAWEAEYFCNVKLPENAGFTYPAVTVGTQQLGRRINIKVLDTFHTTTDMSNPNREDDIKNN